jgi:hypothetical protein
MKAVVKAVVLALSQGVVVETCVVRRPKARRIGRDEK